VERTVDGAIEGFELGAETPHQRHHRRLLRVRDESATIPSADSATIPSDESATLPSAGNTKTRRTAAHLSSRGSYPFKHRLRPNTPPIGRRSSHRDQILSSNHVPLRTRLAPFPVPTLQSHEQRSRRASEGMERGGPGRASDLCAPGSPARDLKFSKWGWQYIG